MEGCGSISDRHRLLSDDGHFDPSSLGLSWPHVVAFRNSGTPRYLPAHQVHQKPRQWRCDSEDDAFDDDLVTHYQASAINLSDHAEKGTDTRPAQLQRLSPKDATLEAGVRIATSQVREILAETVVQYGDDVTMWSSGPSKKSALIREAR